MSIKDGLIFREMAQRLAVTAALVEQLLEEVALQGQRLEALEMPGTAANCPRCETHRASNAERVRRHRNVTKKPDGAREPAIAEAVSA